MRPKPKRFAEFVAEHRKLLSAVSFQPGTPGFWDLARTWNTIAIMTPEACEDVVTFRHVGDENLLTEPNPYREGALRTPEGKPVGLATQEAEQVSEADQSGEATAEATTPEPGAKAKVKVKRRAAEPVAAAAAPVVELPPAIPAGQDPDLDPGLE